MGQPAAKKNDQVVAVDTHIVMVPAPPGPPVPTPLPHPFAGLINGNLSSNVNIMGQPSIHGSQTVKINGKMAARNGDAAMTCNDPADMLVGQVIAVGTVFIG